MILKKFLTIVCLILTACSLITGCGQTPEEQEQQKIEQEQREKQKAEEKAAKEKEKAEKEQKKAEEKAAKEQKKAEEKAQKAQEKMIKSITTGWNTKTTSINEDNDNLYKAANLIRDYPDYVHNAPENWIDVVEAMKKPWDYYGKVVNLSGQIYSIEQLPPKDSIAKKFDGKCYSAMMMVGGEYLAIWIAGDSDGIPEYGTINVKGYICGHVTLQNSMGGTNQKGICFVGFRE